MQGNPQLLEKNLAALAVSSPATAHLVAATTVRTDFAPISTPQGPSATIGQGPSRIHLASRARPVDEGKLLAGTVDPIKSAAVVVLGFGLGYHARALAERLGEMSAIFIFEPDLALLRASLETVDHSAWLRKGNIVILTDPDDGAAISAAVRGVEGLIGLGVRIIEHPASKARLATDQAGARFAAQFTKVVEGVKTAVVTALMQTDVSVRNMLMNADRYALAAGVEDLAGAAAGRAAIIVSAGPSLRRNIDLLARPGVRDRFVIIAVQTVLKQLLARGIRPHFVTSLDYHEISRRFFEGLTAADVDGVTLVAEAQANPAVLEAFPGALRMPAMDILEMLLGPQLSRGRGELRRGATVAHLAYYLARHMGCDPVILIGQDLAFTDGLYYAPGAAIHQVWSGELSGFNSLEMMEWQRIVRGRTHLHRACDARGRPVYTDEQMHSYLVQFERDFAADAARGGRTIDATEGGIAKAGTEAMTLARAIEQLSGQSLPTLRTPGLHAPGAESLRPVEARLRQVREGVWKIGEHSRHAADILRRMLDRQQDQRAIAGLIAKVEKIRDEVAALEPAWSLVQHLNQTGTLKRVRADREIALLPELTALDRQRKQIERDMMNVRWLAEAADRLGALLDATLKVFAGGPRLTRDPDPISDDDEAGDGLERALPREPAAAGGPGRPGGPAALAVRPSPRQHRSVWALVPTDLEQGGLGTPRRLEDGLIGGISTLRLTLLRLARCTEIQGAVILTPEPQRARELAGAIPGLKLECERVPAEALRERAAAVRGARLWSRSCWRGGLASWTVYDEALLPRAMAPVMASRGIDAALLVQADWCLVDPELADEAVRRYRQRPSGRGAHRMCLVHAAPGLGACVLERSLMQELAEAGEGAGVFGSIGGMVGYIPIAPVSDPLSKPYCVAADPVARDAQQRFIPDSPPRRAMLARALALLGENLVKADAAAIAALVAEHQAVSPPGPPQELVLEVCTGRLTSGARGAWLRGSGDSVERPILSLAAADRLFGEIAELRPDAALTLHGAGDPLLHPEILRIIALARKAGIAGVHLRTDLACEAVLLDRLLEADIDIISIDLMAESAPTYRAVMGADLFQRVRANAEYLVTRRDEAPAPSGVRLPWIVPRITRCEATLAEIEPFFDRWILCAGAAVIDPLPGPIAGERIEPLPVPPAAASRLARERLVVLSDGRAATDGDFSGERALGNALQEGLAAAWRRVCSRRAEAIIEPFGRPQAWRDGSLARRVASPRVGAEP
jgi:hypothetical protein